MLDCENENSSSSWYNFSYWYQWRPTSLDRLKQSESKMLEFVKCKLEKKYVELENGHQLWTVNANQSSSNKTPLVMVHGFGGGIGLWALNYDILSEKRPIYAFDLLGFGRSSRPVFDSDPREAEKMFVESIEEWRKASKLDKFILLGHSFGGYLASSYALKYPDNVKKLVLVDPWGFPKWDPTPEALSRVPLWIRVVVRLLSPFNPLAIVRAAGPLGPNLIQRFRADFKSRYSQIIDKDENAVFDYIYHCNAATPSGEVAFKSMNQYLGYSYNPMLSRISALRSDVPVTFIYGARSWMDINSGHETQKLLPENSVDVYSIKGAGHHVYADRPDLFHMIVDTVCEGID